MKHFNTISTMTAMLKQATLGHAYWSAVSVTCPITGNSIDRQPESFCSGSEGGGSVD